MAGLVKALKSKGLEAKSYALEVEDLTTISLPAILHFAPDHFVTLLKIENNIAVFLDPPTRLVQLPLKNLAEIWTKRAVVINSEKSFRPNLQALHVKSPGTTNPSAYLAEGQAAPEFALPDMNGQVRKLGEWRDKKHLLLTFFPRCFTPG